METKGKKTNIQKSILWKLLSFFGHYYNYNTPAQHYCICAFPPFCWCLKKSVTFFKTTNCNSLFLRFSSLIVCVLFSLSLSLYRFKAFHHVLTLPFCWLLVSEWMHEWVSECVCVWLCCSCGGMLYARNSGNSDLEICAFLCAGITNISQAIRRYSCCCCLSPILTDQPTWRVFWNKEKRGARGVDNTHTHTNMQ